MKKTVCILLIVLFCYTADAEDRFEITYQQGNKACFTQILKDTETGQLYLFHKFGRSAGLTRLIGKDEYTLRDFKDDIMRRFMGAK